MKENKQQLNPLTRPSKLLAIDTSTAVLAMALLQEGKVVDEVHVSAERNHSIRLVPNIQERVKALGWSMRELEGIAIGQGPGSYTGVRIGVTVAKTMAWTLGLPLAGGSSLEALAYSYRLYGEPTANKSEVHREWIVPLMNARRGNVYTCRFEMRDDLNWDQNNPSRLQDWHRLSVDGIRSLDEWLLRLEGNLASLDASNRPGRICFAGEIEGLEDKLSSFGSAELRALIDVQAVKQDMRGEAIGLLAYDRWLTEAKQDVHEFIPNYTQLAEAEVNWLAKQKPEQGVNACE
jgi:tRNA threonylcarbamoyladenosine biosynthesis protein TsaB